MPPSTSSRAAWRPGRGGGGAVWARGGRPGPRAHRGTGIADHAGPPRGRHRTWPAGVSDLARGRSPEREPRPVRASPGRVYDKPVIDKLGVFPGARVAVMGVADPDFRAAPGGHPQDITDGGPPP